jgi:hypothetical protein
MAITLRYFDDAMNNTLQAALTANTIEGIGENIAWPEKTFAPVKGVPWLKPELAARSRRPVGFGADSVQQWDGTFQVGIFVPRDSGTRLQNQIASQILAVFKRGLALQTPDGVWITVTRGTAPVAVPYGDWINLPVQIDWFATEPP